MGLDKRGAFRHPSQPYECLKRVFRMIKNAGKYYKIECRQLEKIGRKKINMTEIYRVNFVIEQKL